MSSKQQAFTLLELVIAMAIFTALGMGSWRLFDAVVRAQSSTGAHERDMRSLQRAIAVIERDVLQVTSRPLLIQQGTLHLQRGNWRNPLDQPRSEVQNITYRLDSGTLWRESTSDAHATVHRQRILSDVHELRWQFYARMGGWHSDLTTYNLQLPPQPLALEITFTTARFTLIRRVLLLPGSAS